MGITVVIIIALIIYKYTTKETVILKNKYDAIDIITEYNYDDSCRCGTYKGDIIAAKFKDQRKGLAMFNSISGFNKIIYYEDGEILIQHIGRHTKYILFLDKPNLDYVEITCDMDDYDEELNIYKKVSQTDRHDVNGSIISCFDISGDVTLIKYYDTDGNTYEWHN